MSNSEDVNFKVTFKNVEYDKSCWLSKLVEMYDALSKNLSYVQDEFSNYGLEKSDSYKLKLEEFFNKSLYDKIKVNNDFEDDTFYTIKCGDYYLKINTDFTKSESNLNARLGHPILNKRIDFILNAIKRIPEFNDKIDIYCPKGYLGFSFSYI